MMDERIRTLAQNLVRYSTSVQKDERVLIETFDGNQDLVRAVIAEVYRAGGQPFVKYNDMRIRREMLLGATEEQLRLLAENDAALMRQMQVYIGIRGSDNVSELSDVPQEKMQLFETIYSSEVHSKIRVPDTKWVVLRYPSPAMAQMAKMSTDAFEDFYFDVCNLDYRKMGEAMQALKARMEHTDKVRLLGPSDTDLTFSIKGIPAIPCDGHMNIPDGEVYTAPVRNSVNGVIHYNTPSPHGGFVYEDVRLVFKDGKIIESTSNDTERIEKVFDTDESARYVGEFAIGVHPYITKPMGDILFDEKICGSIHFTPGSSYDDAFNGNKSALHWDLVLIQTPEYGGGEIYFDDELIRKDGCFVVPDLECLNPENLK